MSPSAEEIKQAEPMLTAVYETLGLFDVDQFEDGGQAEHDLRDAIITAIREHNAAELEAAA